MVYVEGRQAEKMLQKFSKSKDPFDKWFSKQTEEIRGLKGPPPNELLVDIL